MRAKLATWVLIGLAATSGCAGQTRAPSFAGSYASVDGLRMYYESAGVGAPLVLIHGGGSTAQTSFGRLIPLLAKNHRVIAPEEQGHGHTADIDRPFSFEQMADDTAALLGQLGVEQADVLGFSNGARVALLMAMRHPNRVRRLILASGYATKDGLPPQFWQGMQHASPDSMPPVLRDAYLAASPGPDLARFVDKTKAMMLGSRDVRAEELRGIQTPVLIMVGDSDVVRPEHEMEMFRLLPHARLAVFPGSLHGAYLGAAETARPGSKQPEIAAAMIEEFLEAQSL